MDVNTCRTRAPGPVPARKGGASPAPASGKPVPHQNPIPRTLRPRQNTEAGSQKEAIGVDHWAPSSHQEKRSRVMGATQGLLQSRGREGPGRAPADQPRSLGTGSLWALLGGAPAGHLEGSHSGQLTFLWLAVNFRGVSTHAGKQVQWLQVPRKH